MANKQSRRKRSKRPYQPKPTAAAESVSPAVAVTPPVAGAAASPIPTARGPVRARPEMVTAPAAATARSPYVSADLRKIGIMAIIMIAVLAVLSRVL